MKKKISAWVNTFPYSSKILYKFCRINRRSSTPKTIVIKMLNIKCKDIIQKTGTEKWVITNKPIRLMTNFLTKTIEVRINDLTYSKHWEKNFIPQEPNIQQTCLSKINPEYIHSQIKMTEFVAIRNKKY